jgi:hypothetical protein
VGKGLEGRFEVFVDLLENLISRESQTRVQENLENLGSPIDLSSQVLADVAKFPTLSWVKVFRNGRGPVSNKRGQELYLGFALGLDEFP